MTDIVLSSFSGKKRIPRTPEEPMAFILYVLRHCSTAMKKRAVAALVSETVAVSSDVMVAFVLGRIVGVMVETQGDIWPALTHELLLLCALWTVRNAGFRGREFFERAYVPELLNTTRELLFSRLIQQSQAFLNGNFAGVLANHVRRAGDIVGALRDKMQYNIAPLIVRFVTASILLWHITPLFAPFILFFVGIGLFAAKAAAKRWTSIALEQAEAASRLTGYIVDSTTNLSLVKQNVGWREERGRLDEVHEELTGAYRRRMTYSMWFWGMFDVAMTFFFCGFMLLLAFAWQKGHVTVAQLSMTVGVVVNLFGALAGAISLVSSKFDDIGILKESLQKISTPLGIRDIDNAQDLKVGAGTIEFRDISFSYSGREKLFSGLSLSIPAGQKVGLVGVSGAGKTTLCQLLLRAYDVDAGGIYLDGQNIAQATQDSLHASIAVIPQDPTLFHRTLGENIRYGKRSASDADIRNAAQGAAIDAFIDDLPQRYDTLVGERGLKLSGGQRQRIAIARAIVKDAPILVLDEATSALDSETERSIQQVFGKVMQGRTTLVIAHRLSTLSYMDRIVVMEDGRVVEDGGFQELLKRGGIFSRLWALQAGGFLPDTI